MTSISKSVYINKLGDIVKKCSNTYHRTIKMKNDEKKSKTYINFDKENNHKVNVKFKVNYYVSNVFAKDYIPN